MSAIWLFLKAVPSWVWVALALLAGGLFYGHTRYNAGQEDVQGKWDAEHARMAAEIADLKTKQGKVTTKVETKYVDRIKTIREKGDVIVREVPVYVPADSCDLPGGFRVLHDAASQGIVPDPADIPDAAPVPAQEAAGTVAGNYSTCLQNAEQLTGLQEWVREQQRLNP